MQFTELRGLSTSVVGALFEACPEACVLRRVELLHGREAMEWTVAHYEPTSSTEINFQNFVDMNSH